MNNTRWTPSMVEEWLAEAADVLKRLPEVRVQGYFSTWPPIVRDFWEAFGWHEIRLRLGPPSAAAIDRMDAALLWLRWLNPDDAKIIWLRASGERWKEICWKVGLQRSAAHQHWLFALSLIAWRLNGGRASRVASRAREILRARGAKPHVADSKVSAGHFSPGQNCQKKLCSSLSSGESRALGRERS